MWTAARNSQTLEGGLKDELAMVEVASDLFGGGLSQRYRRGYSGFYHQPGSKSKRFFTSAVSCTEVSHD